MESEMGFLGSPSTTSYRLPIVTIGLSLTVFAVLRVFQTDRQTDGRNWSSNRRQNYALKCIGRLCTCRLLLNQFRPSVCLSVLCRPPKN